MFYPLSSLVRTCPEEAPGLWFWLEGLLAANMVKVSPGTDFWKHCLDSKCKGPMYGAPSSTPDTKRGSTNRQPRNSCSRKSETSQVTRLAAGCSETASSRWAPHVAGREQRAAIHTGRKSLLADVQKGRSQVWIPGKGCD